MAVATSQAVFCFGKTALSLHGANCPCCSGRQSAAKGINSFTGLRKDEQPTATLSVDRTAIRVQHRRLRLSVSAAAATGIYVDTQPRKIKRAAPAAVATIAANFPNAMEHESFITACAQALFKLGFSKDNCIALANTCRDEVCRPLVSLIDKEFGHSFNISGLGGLVNCGKTGLKAGMSHSPEHPCESDGSLRERYVFFAFPHISIGESGQPGSLLRRGRGKPSSACGALIAVKSAAMETSEADGPYPADDFEFASLKRKVLAKPVCASCGPEGPTLVDVTKAAMEVITEDLEDLISKTVDPATADYAVITGVQIHSGYQLPGEPFQMDRCVDYIAPARMYAVIRGEKMIMHPEVAQIETIVSVKESDMYDSVSR